MAAAKDDLFDAEKADGRIRLRINGTDYVLKRPKIKEFRKLRETLFDISRKATAETQPAEAALQGDGVDDEVTAAALSRLDFDAIAEREDELLGWWAEVFGMLEEKDQPLPDPEDLPLWLLGRGIVPEMMAAWMNRPARPGA